MPAMTGRIVLAGASGHRSSLRDATPPVRQGGPGRGDSPRPPTKATGGYVGSTRTDGDDPPARLGARRLVRFLGAGCPRAGVTPIRLICQKQKLTRRSGESVVSDSEMFDLVIVGSGGGELSPPLRPRMPGSSR